MNFEKKKQMDRDLPITTHISNFYNLLKKTSKSFGGCWKAQRSNTELQAIFFSCFKIVHA